MFQLDKRDSLSRLNLQVFVNSYCCASIKKIDEQNLDTAEQLFLEINNLRKRYFQKWA